MIKHKYILKNNSSLLSNEFVSPLFLFYIESLVRKDNNFDFDDMVKAHVAFFWKAIKR